MDRITIIGMGPIGVSIGLGLKRSRLKDTEIVGADADRKVLSRVSKLGAVDRTTGNLRSALEGAQLVVLDTAVADTREMLEAIGPVLREGCVVTDTGAVKTPVLTWAETYLRDGTSFIGGRPLPARLLSSLDDADGALFEGTQYCVVAGESADPESVKTVVGMVEALGARPVFLSPEEHDSYAAALVHLPLALSAVLVRTAAGSRSWSDMSRLAAAEFSENSFLASTDPRESAADFQANPAALVHWLDQAIEQLHSIRSQVAGDGDELLETLVEAWEHRARWEAGPVGTEQEPFEAPSAAQRMGGMVFGHGLTRRYSQMMSPNKAPAWQYKGDVRPKE